VKIDPNEDRTPIEAAMELILYPYRTDHYVRGDLIMLCCQGDDGILCWMAENVGILTKSLLHGMYMKRAHLDVQGSSVSLPKE
jgi:hypothetical protein